MLVVVRIEKRNSNLFVHVPINRVAPLGVIKMPKTKGQRILRPLLRSLGLLHLGIAVPQPLRPREMGNLSVSIMKLEVTTTKKRNLPARTRIRERHLLRKSYKVCRFGGYVLI